MCDMSAMKEAIGTLVEESLIGRVIRLKNEQRCGV